MAEDLLLFLPAELPREILLHADTPDQLYTLIRASPRLYQVFLNNKELILSTVARRQFHPAVLTDALTFAKLSQFEQPLSRDTAIEFCQIDPSKLREWQDTNTPISESVALFKLASNVKFFIQDYTRNTLPIMEGLGQSKEFDMQSEYWPEHPTLYSDLSVSEIGRLQRAFCRFEIYRYLFAKCSSELNHDIRNCFDQPSLSPAEQASLYLKKFPDFQIAEINCIRDYLVRRLRGICSRLEDNAVESLSPEDLNFEYNGQLDEDALWTSEVYFFTRRGKYEQIAHLEHLMSLGLPYIRRIFESTGEEEKALWIRHCPRRVIRHLGEREFITFALRQLGRNPAQENISLLAETDPPFVYDTKSGVELDIPDAWQWAHPRTPPIMLSEIGVKGLRDWGFVFWDFERLRESGILKRSREDVRMIDYDEWRVQNGPSVEERLLGSNPVSSTEGDNNSGSNSDSEGDRDSNTSIDSDSDSDRSLGISSLWLVGRAYGWLAEQCPMSKLLNRRG